nr:hypothetical protein [Phytohabitans houttuyneae]
MQKFFRHVVQPGKLAVTDVRNALDDRICPRCGTGPENAHAADCPGHPRRAEIGSRILVGVEVRIGFGFSGRRNGYPHRTTSDDVGKCVRVVLVDRFIAQMSPDLGGSPPACVDHRDIDSRGDEKSGESAAYRAGTDDKCALRHDGLHIDRECHEASYAFIGMHPVIGHSSTFVCRLRDGGAR